MPRIARTRGVKGAASMCALTALLYLCARTMLRLAASALARGGVSALTGELLQLLVSIGSFAVPMAFLLSATRLEQADLRLTKPAPWSPVFIVPVFLGVANAGNLLGGLLSVLMGTGASGTQLPENGAALVLGFFVLCAVPAVCEELLFRGAMQGLMRPCGSAAAIFGPALLFALLHGDLVQGLTAFVCAIFLGWLAERTGSILPGMLLHFLNNCLAFLSLYLRQFALGGMAVWAELFILVGFPLWALWLLYQAWRQGFRWSAGLRPGVDVLSVFTSPAYTVGVLFLLILCIPVG